MNTKQIRISVAECFGWTTEHYQDEETKELVLVWRNPSGTYVRDCFLPNYPDSLDACGEFEKTLTENEYRRFVETLVTVLKPGEFSVRATALQRCEAYLRVKGKWTE